MRKRTIDKVIFWDIESYGEAYLSLHKQVKEYAVYGAERDHLRDFKSLTIESFIKQILDSYETSLIWKRKDNKRYKGIDINLYAHNAGGFDNFFIIKHFTNYLANHIPFNGWEVNEENKIITDKKKIIMYDLEFTKNNNKINLNFRDTLLMFPQKLAKIGELVNAPKGDVEEYDIIDTFKNWEEFENYKNGSYWKYLKRDVDILVEYDKQLMDENFYIEKEKLTAASLALQTWKNTYEPKKWDDLFKNKLSETEWRIVNQTYFGGITTPLNLPVLEQLDNIISIDVNSLYPSVMIGNQLPYGKPKTTSKSLPSYPFKIYKFEKLKATVKKDKFPFLNINNFKSENNKNMNFKQTGGFSPIIDIEDPFYLNSIDYKNLKKYYDIELEEKTIELQFKTSITIFKKFIEQNYHKKENAKNDIEKFFAKLNLNSVYGKNGENIDKAKVEIIEECENIIKTEKNYWYIREYKIFGETIKVRKPATRFKSGDKYYYYVKDEEETVDESHFSYVPLASAITSLARESLINGIDKVGYLNCAYSDTDSIKFKVPNEVANTIRGLDSNDSINEYLCTQYDLKFHKGRIGEWGYEGIYDRFVARRAKHYGYVENGEFTIKGGGFNVKYFNGLPKDHKDKITFEEYLQKEFTVNNGKKTKDLINGVPIIKTVDYKFSIKKGE